MTKNPILLKLLEPLMNDMNTWLGIDVEHSTRRKHGNEILGREPFELLRLKWKVGRVGLQVRKIEKSIRAIESPGSLIISHGSFFGGGE